MQNFMRFKLLSEKQAFIDDLRPKYILSSLILNKVLTYKESQMVQSAETPAQQVEKLFEILITKNHEAFLGFIKALKYDEENCETYPWLAEKLEAYFDEQNRCISEKLASGSVPYQINYLLPMEIKVNSIRYILKQLVTRAQKKENRCWAVLFGPIGSGKSVLAAEVVRNVDLVENYFSNGVYWIQMGFCQDDEAIKLKMKRLFKLLDIEIETHPNDSIYDLSLILRQNIVKRQKTLIILDDIWSAKEIKAFDIGCPILVTTRDKRALDDVSSYCSWIECQNDLGDDEIKELLSQYVKCKPNELPPIIDEISRKCKGSPMVTSLIGITMREFNDENRWQQLNAKLDNSIYSAVRKRHSSRDEWTEKMELIKFCLEELEERIDNLMQHFFRFCYIL